MNSKIIFDLTRRFDILNYSFAANLECMLEVEKQNDVEKLSIAAEIAYRSVCQMMAVYETVRCILKYGLETGHDFIIPRSHMIVPELYYSFLDRMEHYNIEIPSE